VLWIVGPILVVATLVIIYLCYTWMQSTRASQRRTEAQNQRVIELLSEIATALRDRR
jgi:Flp pilus assembly protein TadB